MHKVQRMTQAPMTCLYCGRGNIPDDPDTEDTMWFLDLERDVNWGDSTYLCKYCCDRIGVISGLVGMEDLEQQQKVNRHLQRKVHKLEASLQERDRRIERIIAGEREMTRAKKQHKRTEDLKERTRAKKVTVDE